MRHGSLFSGIGGFDLAAEWMGWENVFHCENNPFCQKILKHYWPDAKSYGDIKETDFSEWKGKVDIVSGGFPCQPYSQAGKRKGTADDRHLWPEMLRAIREVQPSWVVGENVYGLLNWQRGMVLDEIKSDLEAAGLEVFPPLILPACGKNAPHRRDRLWIVAYSRSSRTGASTNGCNESWKLLQESEWEKDKQFNKSFSEGGTFTDTKEIGIQGGRAIREQESRTHEQQKLFMCSSPGTNWNDWPTVSPIRGRDDGLSSKLVKQCLEGLGNAVVPQVVFEIFKAIEKVNENT